MKSKTVAAMLLLVFALASVPTAGAVYDPVAGGTTELKLDPAFLGLLRREGVKLEAAFPAVLRRGTVMFPVADGKFDPSRGKGTLRHDGALVFSKGRQRLPLRALQLKTSAKRSPLSAKLGGGQLKLAKAQGLVVSRSGFDDRVRIATLALSAKAATRLAKKLDLRGKIIAGQPIGRTATVAHPAGVSLSQGAVELAFDPAFEAKLRSLFVAVNPIFPAERPGAFTLPIFAGRLSPEGPGGTLETRGSLEFLQLGGGQVFWVDGGIDLTTSSVNAEVDVKPSPPFGGELGRLSLGMLIGGAYAADSEVRTLSLGDGVLTLDAATAAIFDEVFAKPQGEDNVFVPGEPFGLLSFRSKAQ